MGQFQLVLCYKSQHLIMIMKNKLINLSINVEILLHLARSLEIDHAKPPWLVSGTTEGIQ